MVCEQQVTVGSIKLPRIGVLIPRNYRVKTDSLPKWLAQRAPVALALQCNCCFILETWVMV